MRPAAVFFHSSGTDVEGLRSDTMVDALPTRSLLLRILDALAEWQMRQSLRVICRGKEPCTGA